MFSEQIAIKTRRNFIRTIPFIPVVLFLILFRQDVGATFRFFWRLLLLYVGIPMPPFTLETLFSLLIVGFNLFIGFFLFFLIWLFLISKQALLPVSSFEEIIQTSALLIFYILRVHGPAVFVKDGKVRANAEELRRNFPGVAVVDSNSALVLEKVSWAPRYLATVMDFLLNLIIRALESFRSSPVRRDPVRVCGPGLVFIRYDERIVGVGDLLQEHGPVKELSGVVDLQRQFKQSPKQSHFGPEMKNSVGAYTRDGIELTTNVWALFTIGQEPDKAPNVIEVVCDGELRPENLQVVSLNEENGAVHIEIKEGELSLEDRKEIIAYLDSGPELFSYSKLERGKREPVFDPGQVFLAVYGRSRARDDKTKVLPWLDLPVKVAVDEFREILSHYNFDELYRQDTEGRLKINDLRKELLIRMRNSGLLCYRVIRHRRPNWTVVREDQDIDLDPSDLLVTPVMPLQNPKILRDRGILMFASGFGNLVPADEVYLQMLASWRAEWEQDTTSARAAADLDAIRIYNRARVKAQQELAVSFQEIFESGRHPKEALTLRILQALESIAADGETRRLLPGDTINMLRTIHDWLLPGDIGFGVGQRTSPETPPVQEEDKDETIGKV